MRILHVFRTPVGGLFRHVRDLARGQKDLGHEVGILCDSTTGGATAERLLSELAAFCSLGVARIPISRLPGLGDVSGALKASVHGRTLRPDVVHCHGAKGGLFGRLAAWRMGVPSVYTPHGGSLHYDWSSPAGAVFLSAEHALGRIGDGLIFVCNYERDTYAAKIGWGGKPHVVVHNGLWPEEFEPITPPPQAADILFIGDMRLLKGVDVLLEAVAALRKTSGVTACLVGDGPDLALFKAQAAASGLGDAVQFPGRLPAREAFRRGRILVMPSRAESFPYVVLEAAAAGVPMIASAVGGIPEVMPRELLFPAGDVAELAASLDHAIANPQQLLSRAGTMRQRIAAEFTASAMTAGVMSFYERLRS